MRRKRYTLEVKFTIGHTPFIAYGEGNDLEEILADAEYSVDCPDPVSYVSIDELPEAIYDEVVEGFTGEIADANEYAAERDR